MDHPVHRLADELSAHEVGVVGVQTPLRPWLGSGNSITITTDGGRRLIRLLGADGHDQDALHDACATHGLDHLTVSSEHGNVRIGAISAEDTVVLIAAVGKFRRGATDGSSA